MQPLLRAFISSSADLLEYRDVLSKALLTSGVQPVLWENLPAQAESIEHILERTIESADLVIALVGHRMGVTPRGEARSYLEMELERARELGKRIYLFFFTGHIPADELDPSQLEAVSQFRKRISKDLLYSEFSNRSELELAVAKIRWTEEAAQGRSDTGFRVFLCYRRKDLAALCVTARLYERMVREFGHNNVFLDVKSIPLGRNLRDEITAEISRANIVFAIIGPTWKQDIIDRRDDPRDFVRIEIESAFQLSITTIPILLGDVELPLPHDLPSSIENLADVNGFQMDVGFPLFDELDRLVEELRQWFGDQYQ